MAMAVPFRAISVFHAVARARSVSKAAVELGVTPSAVSQQIHLLETLLGTALVAKAGRRIKLTSVGERYFELISTGIDRVAEATARIQGFRSTALLNIRATPSLSTKWLLPRLPCFLKANPNLDVRLNATNEPTDFTREDVDVDIRPGLGQWTGIAVEGFAKERFLPVCSPSYAAAGSLSAAEIASHVLIQSVKCAVQWSDWFAASGLGHQRYQQRLLLDRSHMSVDAAVSGVGIALESTVVMGEALGAGALVCPAADPPRVEVVAQWITYPHDHLRRQRVRAFIEWLRAERDAWVAADDAQWQRLFRKRKIAGRKDSHGRLARHSE
jgi:DNA-binding transcriptional LysR family regulator